MHDPFEEPRVDRLHFLLVYPVQQPRYAGHYRRFQNPHVFEQELYVTVVETDRTTDQVHAVL